jgi:hypothetical protein
VTTTLSEAINFLETQWSSINENKVKGILAELRFKDFLILNNHHFVSGGWIVTPGKPTLGLCPVPSHEKICILPRQHRFTWQGVGVQNNSLTPAEMSAYNYFRQVGVRALFATPIVIVEAAFELPSPSERRIRARYPKPYELQLQEVSPAGSLIPVSPIEAFRRFPMRNGNVGMRCYQTNRIDQQEAPWTSPAVVSDLFWFEYARYFFQVDYLLSNNDLDIFVIGPSGASYPVELKSKASANDSALGEWFGIDIGPFAKLSFFTSNAMNNDALYVVEEVTAQRVHVQWLGIRFTDLVKSCSWVGRSGGTGMMGGASSTYKIPKDAFSSLSTLMATL